MYTEIFCDITDLLHTDYAGCIDKKGWDKSEKYANKIQKLEDED